MPVSLYPILLGGYMAEDKKVVKTKAAPKAKSSVNPKSELMRAQDFAEVFKLSKPLVTKLIEDAKAKVIFSQPYGRGFINLYAAAEVNPILQKYVDDKAAEEAKTAQLKAEREKKLQQKANAKSQQELPLQAQPTVFDLNPIVLEPLKNQISELSGVMHRSQDMNSKQFELLNTQVKILEKQLSSIYHAVTSLENTLLAIHTAPAVQPEAPSPAPSPEPVKSEEANKGQEFFQGSPATETPPTAPTKSKTLTLGKEKDKAVDGSGEASQEGQASGQAGSVAAKRQKRAKADGDNTPKPRVLIIGLHDNKVCHFNEFMNHLDMTIINPDNAKAMGTRTMPTADYTIQLLDFVSHSASNNAAADSKLIQIRGGLTKLRHALVNIQSGTVS